MQLSYNGVSSNAVRMPISDQFPGLLSNQFPAVPTSQSNFPDGNVRNEDGTRNDAEHPAAAGSTITVFVTGLGVAKSPITPGSIATEKTLVSVMDPFYSPWESSPEAPPVYSVPRFVSALLQIPIQVPVSISSLGGTDVENGVKRVPFYLIGSAALEGTLPPPAPSNSIGVYVK